MRNPNSGMERVLRFVSPMKKIKFGGAVAPAAGSEFACQQSHNGKPVPLSKAKRLHQLFLGMPKSQRNRIHGRNRQGPPRRELLTSKVLRIDARIKSILADKNAAWKVSSPGFRATH